MAAVTCSYSAISRLSCFRPLAVSLQKRTNISLPPVAASKVCIDTLGAVSAVDVLTKLDRDVAAQLVSALKAWRYAPYVKAGVPTPVCFVVSMRLQ